MTVTIHRLDHETPEIIAALADLLRDCVAAGASVGFMQALDPADARVFWRTAIAAALAGERTLMIARLDDRVIGTAQMIPATMPNQPHRADIAKMMVDPEWQRRGVGRALLDRAEEIALREGRTTLILDTEAGAPSNRLYLSAGWREVGRIPEYARSSSGGLHSTVYYAKWLAPDGSGREPIP